MRTDVIHQAYRANPKILTLKQVGEIFGVGAKTIQRWVREGTFIRPDKGFIGYGKNRVRQFWTAADIEKEKLKRGIK